MHAVKIQETNTHLFNAGIVMVVIVW